MGILEDIFNFVSFIIIMPLVFSIALLLFPLVDDFSIISRLIALSINFILAVTVFKYLISTDQENDAVFILTLLMYFLVGFLYVKIPMEEIGVSYFSYVDWMCVATGLLFLILSSFSMAYKYNVIYVFGLFSISLLFYRQEVISIIDNSVSSLTLENGFKIIFYIVSGTYIAKKYIEKRKIKSES